MTEKTFRGAPVANDLWLQISDDLPFNADADNTDGTSTKRNVRLVYWTGDSGTQHSELIASVIRKGKVGYKDLQLEDVRAIAYTWRERGHDLRSEKAEYPDGSVIKYCGIYWIAGDSHDDWGMSIGQ